MRWDEWEPFYRSILQDFGFSRERDEEAAVILNRLLEGKWLCDDSCLSARISPIVTVCGAAANLGRQIELYGLEGTVLAADNATSTLMSIGVLPDIIVTDLDGNVADQLAANRGGSVAVVHAHGDNIEVLQRHVPEFQGMVVGTTQSEPSGRVRCFGGFTDGDRAVILAKHFRASRIRLFGFDFENPSQKQGKDLIIKRRKLAWAKRLIFELSPKNIEIWIP